MTPTRLTQNEHAILYMESASNVYRQHGNISPKEVDKLVQMEMHSMNLTEARELLTKIRMKLQMIYHVDKLVIIDE